jgi:hypothetical protein
MLNAHIYLVKTDSIQDGGDHFLADVVQVSQLVIPALPTLRENLCEGSKKWR